jgi:8-amino-7-oxononanoate synthase
MLERILRNGALRSLKQRENLIDLTSNDYLGLSRDPAFRQAIIDKWEKWCPSLSNKVGSTGSRLLTGNHRFFEELEEKIAQFHGFASATLFNCGYMGNLGILSSLFSREDTLIADRDVHASIHDGMKLSKAQLFYFRHNDLAHLETRLKNKKRCFVIVESLYSMSGGKAPLSELVPLCEKYGAQLIVDEAHAVGILGPQGQGLAAEKHLQERVFACMCAFGKALGVHGAVVLGSSLLKKKLLNLARPLIYTTAPPLPLLAAIACSYERFPGMQREREHVAALCRQFQFSSHIQPIPAPGNSQAKLLSYYLMHHGIDVRPILSPTVPKGKEQLRLTLHSFNTRADVQTCMERIEKWSGQ